MNRFIRLAALTVASAAGLPAAAHAHVTLQPAEVPAGGFTRLDVRVPNERDNASTTKVEVQFPPGFIFASYEPAPGWSTQIKMAKLDKPVEVFGERHSEQVDTVTFTTRGKGIGPGQFRDFGLSLGMPDKAGTSLTFKALQTYSNGEVVRWIGASDAEQPAPQVKLAAAEDDAAANGSGAAEAQPTTAAAATTSDDGGTDAVSIVALIVGVLGLLAGLAAMGIARRSSSASTSEEPRVTA